MRRRFAFTWRFAFTLIELLVVIAIIAVLIGLLLPAVQKVREAAARTQSINNLKQLALAMNMYCDTMGQLPDNGMIWYTAPFGSWSQSPPSPAQSPGCSWAYKLLPFIEQGNMYNNWSYNTPLKVFLDPGRPGTGLSGVKWDGGQDNTLYNAGALTDYAANAQVIPSLMNTTPGDNTPFGPGPFQFAHHWTVGNIPDGSSNTVLLGGKALATETINGFRGSEYIWSITIPGCQPSDDPNKGFNPCHPSTDDDPIASSGLGPTAGNPQQPGPFPPNVSNVDDNWNGCWGLMRGQTPDNISWFAGPQYTPALGALPLSSYIPGNAFTINSGDTSWYIDTFQIIQDQPYIMGSGTFNRWGGPYAGGGLFAMADGSVHMAAYSTPNTIVIAMCTPQGGEPYTPPW
jgi:prepilin-type N-terminal cleavage/methylation domain-containing protein